MDNPKRPRKEEEEDGQDVKEDVQTPNADFRRWDVEETCQYLQRQGFQKWTEKFREHNISGVGLQYLTEEHLQQMDISAVGDQLRILHSIRKLWQFEPSKVFNDPIHGHIEVHPLLIKFIDTPQFQRLRNIKQLGGTYFVFPGACHNRFEHSIGVGHLAGRLVEVLKERQPELLISHRDVLCVEIAGLCHDLGHGPFSHMFDKTFLPKVRPGFKRKHEDASVAMFNHLVKENKLEPAMKYYGLKLPDDLIFIKEQISGLPESMDSPNGEHEDASVVPEDPKLIKEQISGPPESMDSPNGEWRYQGRPKEMSFLYEIVANKQNGIDVDKWDYFARDCHYLGIQNNFDYRRALKFARVCEVAGTKHICTRDKEVSNLYDMFHTRICLHRRAYQHKVGNIVETMITEAFELADKHLQYKGSKRMFTLSMAIDDMTAYTKLTDHVFEQILHASDLDTKKWPDMAKAREILRNVVHRRLYKFAGQTQAKSPIDSEEVRQGVAKEVAESEDDVVLEPEDLIVHVIYIHYGMKEKNPIDYVHFYCKSDPNKVVRIPKDQVSYLLPECFEEYLIRVYCKKRDETTLSVVRKCFVQWCTDKGFPKPQD